MAIRAAISALTVNAAFLQEIKEVNLDLWRLLEDLRERVQRPEQWSQQLGPFLADLEELRDQLALHFALEEAYGYFEDPVYVAPQLCEQAHALRAEHRLLYVRICRIVELAGEVAGDATEKSAESASVDRVMEEFLAFDDQFRRHESAENELIFREYDDDIGVGD